MNYEKAYKEAIEKARIGKPMDEVFPELKESEDERIRKYILRVVNQWWVRLGDPSPDYPTQNEMLAYLEKQKDEAQRQFNLGVQAGKEEVMYEKQKEQKPAEWSEEDKVIVSGIIGDINAMMDRLSYPEVKALCEKEKDWLNSLPERFNPQPKQEWNEEDKKMLDGIVLDLKLLKERDTGEAGKAAYQKEISWLKSLRPQPHWKPSEEQMEALKYALGKGGTFSKEALDSLLTDLQKLF